jgi:hypothetical protein
MEPLIAGLPVYKTGTGIMTTGSALPAATRITVLLYLAILCEVGADIIMIIMIARYPLTSSLRYYHDN